MLKKVLILSAYLTLALAFPAPSSGIISEVDSNKSQFTIQATTVADFSSPEVQPENTSIVDDGVDEESSTQTVEEIVNEALLRDLGEDVNPETREILKKLSMDALLNYDSFVAENQRRRRLERGNEIKSDGPLALTSAVQLKIPQRDAKVLKKTSLISGKWKITRKSPIRWHKI